MEILDFPWKIGHFNCGRYGPFLAFHLILRGKLDMCGRDDFFFWSSLDFAENWTSAEVMTFYFFGFHLSLRKIGRNVSFFFQCF